MHHASSGRRALRQTAGAVGVLALTALGAAPAHAADSGPNLVLSKIAPIDGVKPGSEFSVPTSFTNTGTAAVDKVWMGVNATRGLSLTEVPSNCTYGEYGPGADDELPGGSGMLCEFDQTVKPGVVYAPERTLTLKATDHALYDELSVTVWRDEPVSEVPPSEPVWGTGPALKLVERPDDTPAAPGSSPNYGSDGKSAVVTAKNTADFQVTGAQLKGKVGDTVPLVVKFTNAGPGWVYEVMGGPPTHVRVTVPAGTSVIKTPGCKSLGSGTYDCSTRDAWVNEHDGETYEFKLKINKAVPGAKGSVALAGDRPFDPIESNDTADILLDVEGDGATGGGGSTPAPEGSATPTPEGSPTPTPEGSETASTGGSGSTSGSGDGTTGGSGSTGTSGSSSTGGDLANTGSGSTLPLTATAAGAVILGAGAVLVARRRAAPQR
ncbi:hypothetical protein [Streptomyces sp. NPDC001020]